MIDIDNDVISIHRTKKDVVVVETNVLEDKMLSLEARGLYCIVRLLPVEFNYSELHHVCTPEQIEKLPELGDELIRRGYLAYKED